MNLLLTQNSRIQLANIVSMTNVCRFLSELEGQQHIISVFEHIYFIMLTTSIGYLLKYKYVCVHSNLYIFWKSHVEYAHGIMNFLNNCDILSLFSFPVCNDGKNVWVCLTCGSVNCGRWVAYAS